MSVLCVCVVCLCVVCSVCVCVVCVCLCVCVHAHVCVYQLRTRSQIRVRQVKHTGSSNTFKWGVRTLVKVDGDICTGMSRPGGIPGGRRGGWL